MVSYSLHFAQTIDERLLAHGMNPGAALAFLIAGPTTTLPAMWGLTTRRIFGLYLAFILVGAIIWGYLYTLMAQ